MKAIILPLNKYYFNFEKYDGTLPAERFWRKHPMMHKVFESKIIIYGIVYPVAFLLVLLFIGPVYLWHLIKSGKKNSRKKMEDILEILNEWQEKLKSKNIYHVIAKIDRNNFSQIIYYSHDVVPKSKNNQESFFMQLELMKKKLNIAHVCEANSKEDIEKVISAFNINPQESFFMTDGKIDLDDYRQLGDEGLSKATFAF